MVMCLGRGADLHMAKLVPLPLAISCSSKSRLVHSLSWFYLSGLAYPSCPRQNLERRKTFVVVVVDWVKKCMVYEVEGARLRKKTWREIV